MSNFILNVFLYLLLFLIKLALKFKDFPALTSVFKDFQGACEPCSACLGLDGNLSYILQGAKKINFTACHLGKLKLAFSSPDVISTSPKSFLTSRIDFTVLLLFEFLKKKSLAHRAS